MATLQFAEKCPVQSITEAFQFPVPVDVLRLDMVHPVVSGNKWFKLKYYVEEAVQNKKNTLLTFGGAYSNHIVATAAAASLQNLKSIGIIRGEKPVSPSPALQQAAYYGMQLFYVSREEYKRKSIPGDVFATCEPAEICVVPEGGYGQKGVEGVKEILVKNEGAAYSHIITAVGTGTTLAGLTLAAAGAQKIIGVSVFKNNLSLQTEIEALLPTTKHESFSLLHQYHFGGYAKQNARLLDFMNEVYTKTTITTDFVYTAKAFYGAFDLIRQHYFSPSDRLLIIHTGGLQGNRSLKSGTLIFAT